MALSGCSVSIGRMWTCSLGSQRCAFPWKNERFREGGLHHRSLLDWEPGGHRMWSPFVSSRKRKWDMYWEPPLQGQFWSWRQVSFVSYARELIEPHRCAEDVAERWSGPLVCTGSWVLATAPKERSSDSLLYLGSLNKACIFSSYYTAEGIRSAFP